MTVGRSDRNGPAHLALPEPAATRGERDVSKSSPTDPPETVTADATFAVVPTWVLDAPISSNAVRLYAVLRRYADYSEGLAFPSRSSLSKRMRCSVDTVDRALRELEALPAIVTTRRYGADGAPTSSLYRLLSTPVNAPVDNLPGVAADLRPPSRKDAATVAARMRHKREPLNESHRGKAFAGVDVAEPHERAARTVQHCGESECDERTRMRDTADGRPIRCPLCHPLIAGAL